MDMAGIYAGICKKDKPFESLEKVNEDHSITDIRGDPAYDPLRSDPRYAALLRHMNLQP